MTEAEWLTSDDPLLMLHDLEQRCPMPDSVRSRELRLFGCACCRQVWQLLTDERSRQAVEVAERFADGELVERQLILAHQESAAALPANPAATMAFVASKINDLPLLMPRAVGRLLVEETIPGAVQAALLRDIFGNPFRPVLIRRGHLAIYRKSIPVIPTLSHIEKAWKHTYNTEDPARWLSWHDGTVPKLACAIYEDRAFDRLPILADALEEAGCQVAEILEHARGPGPHVRGCWLVDLILGKT